ncbi:MAG: 30S ribosomal protein S12 methylthiotransferase RimO [Lachnospiraceae bacterium]|nr:30S ribosomal protein S12 methylthiotransferase RimO [Lachnospiraceae bacterium]
MKILMISLGCDKNLVDSEFMLGSVLDNGFEITDDETLADIIIVNTCCFIHDAMEESIETVLEMAEYKKNGRCRALIVCGCLAQRYHNEIREEIPEVDAVIGTTAYEDIVEAIEEAVGGRYSKRIRDIDYMPSQDVRRVYSTGLEYSYLKIAEGCSKHCTYCIIPKLRGEYRSVPMPELVKQAEYLASCGVKELIIVAQETTLYGTDIYGEDSLPKLLDRLCEVDGIEWIRLLYAYPEDITEELVLTMKKQNKICNYIDMPIQHASDNILKRMGRKTTKAELISKIDMLRSVIPDIVIRTSLITGFPGETDEEHKELLAFVRDIRFERLGVFMYSEEENTPAASFVGQIPEDVKILRYNEIMETQQAVAFEKAKSHVGEVMEIIIEGEIPDDSVYIGRTRMDAPKIDGCVFLPLTGELMTGDTVMARITEAKEYDLLAVPCM